MTARTLCRTLTAILFTCLAMPGSVADVPAPPTPTPKEANPMRPGLTVVPAGPVSDRTRVEIRVALPNDSAAPQTFTIDFYEGGTDPDHRIGHVEALAPAHTFAFARCWWPTSGRAGKRRLRYRARGNGKTYAGTWPIEVIPSDTIGLHLFSAVWVDAGAVALADGDSSPEETERNLRADIDSINHLGIKTIIYTYPEWYGVFYFPSKVEFFDNDVKRMSRGSDCKFDQIEVILSEADKNGQHVLLGLGRNGDLWLTWEFDKPEWEQRKVRAIDISTRVAADMWERYRHHRSLYGWYLTHEMNDLARASAYYNPVADFCHALSPDKVVLIAPAGTPIITKEALERSSVDIVAYQDAVGSGYVPYKNTWNPENRIRMLDEIYTRYAGWHEGADKHCWTDLEIWEMDGSAGYGKGYPADFSRVRRQIEIEAKYVPAITAYQWLATMQDPKRKGKVTDERAFKLYEGYVAYRNQQQAKEKNSLDVQAILP
jgi:hypothetical protein